MTRLCIVFCDSKKTFRKSRHTFIHNLSKKKISQSSEAASHVNEFWPMIHH